jgi:Superfamily II DNA and RNA helicases
LQQNDESSSSPNLTSRVSNSVERTSVADIIAAARKSMRRTKTNGSEISHEHDNDEGEESSNHSDELESKDDDGNSNHSGSSDTSQDEESSSSSSSDDDDDDEVDDVDHSRAMEKDIIRDRQMRSKSRQAPNHRDDNNENDDDDDDSSSSDTEESVDEEAEREAAKAAKYFDNSQAGNAFSNDNVEVFAQLNLSRPLLRGVASVGFVTPTPIQARVIPVVLSGRDVCAR